MQQPEPRSAVRIRRAEPRDLKAVLRLLKELDTFHIGLEPKLFHRFAGPARSAAWLLERFRQIDEVCLVAQLDNSVVGFVWAKAQPAPGLPVFIPERHLLIADLIVTESARQTGIGRQLLARAADWGRRQGLSRVQLSAFTSNLAACALYERLGFRPLSLVLQADLDALDIPHARGDLPAERASMLHTERRPSASARGAVTRVRAGSRKK